MNTLKTAEGLPEEAYYTHPFDPLRVIKVIKGESGYYPQMFRFTDAAAAKKAADCLNAGLSKGQVEAMRAGSMFGWHCPAADPAIYEVQGMKKFLVTIESIHRGRVVIQAENDLEAGDKAEAIAEDDGILMELSEVHATNAEEIKS